MRYVKVKRVIMLAVLLAVAGLALPTIPAARADDDARAPVLPSPLCDSIGVQPGNKVVFHAYALGVQVYRWNGSGWDLARPEANLFVDANYRGKVGTHYGGPTWESNDGSYVVGKRVLNTGCSVDSSAVDWLLLRADSNSGTGIFSSVTFIQRVNTVGGVKPTTDGPYVGAEVKVPYTAEYFFYRAEN